MTNHQPTAATVCDSGSSLRLLGGFRLSQNERTVDLPTDAQRLVALLALRSERMPRAFIAGRLWMDCNQDRAFGNLRSALFRLKRAAGPLVDADSQTLRLAPHVRTDVDALEAAASQVGVAGDSASVHGWDLRTFRGELLPGWYDEWVIVDRERIRQLSLHTLEAMADLLCAESFYASAVQASLAAIQLDPLRESAHRCLIRVYLAEGNRSEAIRVLDEYEVVLRAELGIEPSPKIGELVSQLRQCSASPG